MPKHIYYERCEIGDCGGTCWYCTLAICKVCTLFEGALTTDCPGEKVSMEDSDKIYAGKLDYKDGLGWVNEFNPTNVVALYERYIRFHGSDNQFIKQEKITPFQFKKIKSNWEKCNWELSKI